MTLFLFPFFAELRALIGAAAELREHQVKGYRMFAPASSAWSAAVCGQGKVEAALACACLGEAVRPDRIILTGAAAALSSEPQPGEFVMNTECVEIDFRSTGAEANPPPRFRPTGFLSASAARPWLHAGRILSADADCFDAAEKRRLGERFGALAYAWEGAGFHRALRKLEIPGMEIRVITESVAEERVSLETLRTRLGAASTRFQDLLLHEKPAAG